MSYERSAIVVFGERRAGCGNERGALETVVFSRLDLGDGALFLRAAAAALRGEEYEGGDDECGAAELLRGEWRVEEKRVDQHVGGDRDDDADAYEGRVGER